MSATTSHPYTRCFTQVDDENIEGQIQITNSIGQVDEEDLPSNMEGMEKEELQCVAASYGIDFDDKADVKVDKFQSVFDPDVLHHSGYFADFT